MKAKPECVPCSLGQINRLRKLFPQMTEPMEEAILRRAIKKLQDLEWLAMSPAAISELCIAELVREFGVSDPFVDLKRQYNRSAQKISDLVRTIAAKSGDKLKTALLAAAAGNIVDPGIVDSVNVAETVQKALDVGFRVDHTEQFREIIGRFQHRESSDKERAASASSATSKPFLLYIADNAGEIIFDAIAVEILSTMADITVVVRGGPILNDAMIEDAEFAGITRFAALKTTGCGRLGILEGCSDEFWSDFQRADLVIAKGHANFETIEDTRPGIFFLLTAKCGPVADKLGVQVGDTVFVAANTLTGRRTQTLG